MKALLSVCVCVFFFHTLCKLSFGSTVCYGPSDLRPLALSSSSLTHDVAFYKGARARGGPCLRQMVLEGYMLFFFFFNGHFGNSFSTVNRFNCFLMKRKS